MENEKFHTIANNLTAARLNRRSLLKWSIAGLGMTAMPLLAACGSDDDDEEPAETDTENTPTGSTSSEPTSAPESTESSEAPAGETAGEEETPEEEAGETPEVESTPASSGAGTTGGQVSVLWRTPNTLNPLFSTAGSEQQVERLMFGALVKMNNNLEPVPDMATSIEAADDASMYTFTINEGATFSDGEPLTAADVIFTLERAIDARSGSYWLGRLNGIAGALDYSTQAADSISGLAMPDDYTVEITLEEPDSAFLVTLCNFSGFGILPKHILEEVAPDQLREHTFSLEPTVSAGPFKFVQYLTDQYLELERNDTYWGDPAPLDRIFMRILTPEVGLAQLETGELDLMTLPIAEIERTNGFANAHVESVESPSMSFLAPNMEREYFQDKRVRQAMMYAIDREGLVEAVLQGEGFVRNSPIFGPDWMGVPEGLNEYPYDPDKAKSLLEEAGWDFDQKVELIITPGNNEADTHAQIIQQQLNEIGFQMEILQVDVAENQRRSIQSTDFDIKNVGGGVFRADPSVSGTYMTTDTWTPGGGNYGHYSNPEVDELYPQGKATGDLDERKQIYTDIALLLNDECPWIWLYSPNSIYGVSNRLQGHEPASYIDNKLWSAETWSVSE